MKINITFGLVIKKLRVEKGYTQEELAHKAGVHRTYVGMIERAERNITLENIYKIATALEISLNYIFLEVEKHG